MRAGQVVQELFQFDGGVDVLVLPEQVHHLAVRPRRGLPLAEVALEHPVEVRQEPLPIEPTAVHENRQRFSRVEKPQPPRLAPPVYVESSGLQTHLKRLPMGGRGDRDPGLAGLETVPRKPTHRVRKVVVAFVKLDDMVARRGVED